MSTETTVKARVRFTFVAEAVVDVTGSGEDEYLAEEAAYDQAAKFIEDRVNTLGVPDSRGVTIHASIDGLEGDVEIVEVSR